MPTKDKRPKLSEQYWRVEVIFTDPFGKVQEKIIAMRPTERRAQNLYNRIYDEVSR
jgi:hypothetical protein